MDENTLNNVFFPSSTPAPPRRHFIRPFPSFISRVRITPQSDQPLSPHLRARQLHSVWKENIPRRMALYIFVLRFLHWVAKICLEHDRVAHYFLRSSQRIKQKDQARFKPGSPEYWIIHGTIDATFHAIRLLFSVVFFHRSPWSLLNIKLWNMHSDNIK